MSSTVSASNWLRKYTGPRCSARASCQAGQLSARGRAKSCVARVEVGAADEPAQRLAGGSSKLEQIATAPPSSTNCFRRRERPADILPRLRSRAARDGRDHQAHLLRTMERPQLPAQLLASPATACGSPARTWATVSPRPARPAPSSARRSASPLRQSRSAYSLAPSLDRGATGVRYLAIVSALENRGNKLSYAPLRVHPRTADRQHDVGVENRAVDEQRLRRVSSGRPGTD